MKKTIILLMICCMIIQSILSGCSLKETKTESPSVTDEVSENEIRTVSEYVCIREYDGDHGLNNEMMDTFMSRYCEENGLKYVPWIDAKNQKESEYVRLLAFRSENSSIIGFGYEYPDENAAIKLFHSDNEINSRGWAATVLEMPMFNVRVGKYILYGYGGAWASLLSQVGIDIQPNIYQIPVKEEVPYLKMERAYTADELLDLFRSKDYYICCYPAEVYNAISPDGTETFSIWTGKRLELAEKNKDDLYHGIFDPWSKGTAIGLTAYRCEDCVVISRGDTFLSVIGE